MTVATVVRGREHPFAVSSESATRVFTASLGEDASVTAMSTHETKMTARLRAEAGLLTLPQRHRADY